jgi:hypothetical protein
MRDYRGKESTFAMFLDELEGLQDAHRLIDTAPDREVVAGHVTDVALRIDQEQAAAKTNCRIDKHM